jgi:hypothetical protein
MPNYFKTAWLDIRLHLGDAKAIRRCVTLLAGACFVTQLALIATFLDRAATSQGVVSARDNDAGFAVGTAISTRLYNDNGFRPYGPTYYRLARIIHDVVFAPHDYAEFYQKPIEQQSMDSLKKAHINERDFHFLLMWISALSAATLALLLISTLTHDWTMRFLGAILLLSAFLRDPVWTEMIFRAHPDHLLAAAVAFATLRTWHSFREPNEKRLFRFAGAAWGFVASIKLTITMLIPSFLLFIWPPETASNLQRPIKESLRLALRRGGIFAGYALLVYVLVGFPQSIVIGRVIKFLIQQSRNIIPGDREFLLIWINLFASQFWRPALTLVSLSFIVPLNVEIVASAKRKDYLKLCAFVIMPIGLLWSRRLLSPYTWYPLPFIAMLLTTTVPILIAFSSRLTFLSKVRNSNWTPILLLLATPIWIGTLPNTLNDSLASQQVCRAEVSIVEDIVNAEAAKSSHVLVDPYTPYARVFDTKQIKISWEMHFGLIQPGKTTMIALEKPHYLTFFPKSEGGSGDLILYIQDLEPVRNFYRLFKGHSKATDPYGQNWIKTHEDGCGFEIWKRES